MTSLASGLLLAIVAPVVLLGPGYLVLGLLRAREDRPPLAGDLVQTLGISAAISLALVVLVAFALSQTVGLTRGPTIVTYVLLLAGLGLGYRSRVDGEGEAPDDEAPTPRRSTGQAASPGWKVPLRTVPAILLGLTLAIVATGALIYDGAEPYTQAFYANASEVEATVTAEPGESLAWTLVVENHEQRDVNYTLETVRIPQEHASEPDPPRVPVDEASLALAAGEDGTHTVHVDAPEGGLWKVQTTVYVDGDTEPLTMHRWIAVSGD